MINPNNTEAMTAISTPDPHPFKERAGISTRVAILFLFGAILFLATPFYAQPFYFGADLSYVNEMEDCGVTYYEDQVSEDPYAIFQQHGCNLVRLRLWHTPSWYDELNEGNRYGDLDDVKKAIGRAKAHGMEVLLDFHLSDRWADPGNQLAPQAWLPVVDDTDVLKDSLYNYIFNTLSHLHGEGLLPEWVQIGNETNKGILLSPADNQTWTLNWARNAALFNSALQAVDAVEQLYGQEIRTVIHIAGPSQADWHVNGFVTNGVTGFDCIGLSYYWPWHMPTDIEDTRNIIESLKAQYPDKGVMIVETGYIWTTGWNDNANNLFNSTHPDYSPASPENQREWLIDLTTAVIQAGGAGVVYWEPAWVSSPCRTEWGQGSNYENAAFFDFGNNLLLPGGIEWMEHDYGPVSTREATPMEDQIQILWDGRSNTITLKQPGQLSETGRYFVSSPAGRILSSGIFSGPEHTFQLAGLPAGLYLVYAEATGHRSGVKKITFMK